jgi:glucans biosynthesis protein C
MVQAMRSNLATQIFASRGPLALLGIVLHLCTFYNPANQFPVSREHHWVTMAISDLIHAFRMETFMLIAGVTFAIQIKKYYELNFFWNRTKRLVLPFFLTAVFLNYPVYLLYADSHLVQSASLLNAPRKATIMHLWFLRDLFVITVLAAALYFSTTFTKLISRQALRRFFQNNQFWVVVSLPFLLVAPRALGYLFPIISAESETFGSIETFLRYALFFFVGALLQYMPSIANLIENRSRLRLLFALIILVMAWSVSQFEFSHIVTKTIGFIAKQVCTLLLIALAIQTCYRFRLRLKQLLPHLDQASYSIYLLHLPILILVANATGSAKLPMWLDLPLILVVTTFLCLTIFGVSEKVKQFVFLKPRQLLSEK